jgi:hypothetical protein
MLYSPLALVVTPRVVPFTDTLTPGMLEPSDCPVTLPVRTVPWLKATEPMSSKLTDSHSRTVEQKMFLINERINLGKKNST